MTTIIPLLDSDLLKDSRSDINDNFASLNTDKLEASDIANFETTTQLNARDTANRNRANHTWTQTASTISDFDTEVSNNTDVVSNTNARHIHSNKTILDNTTASFTTADETKLDWIETGAEVNTLNDVIAWTNITIDKTNPLNPIISSSWWGGWSWDVVWPASSTNNALARFDSTTWKLLQNWVVTESDNWDLKIINAIELDITPTTITNAEWVISWNAVDKTIDINQGNDVIQQVWQEQYWRWKNQTWSTINQPSVVYANGAVWVSWLMTIAKYIADWSIPWIYTLWITTENIVDWWDWFITTFGKIRWIDTSAWVEWDVLYVSPTTAWLLTNVKPSLPNLVIPIAFVIVSHSVNWVIAVRVPTPTPLSSEISYDNTTSWLSAVDVKLAIDELSSEKANDTEVVKLTWNQTIAWIKTFTSKMNVTYWEGIYNNTVTANPLIKSDYDFAWTWFWDSTRITPWWNFVTTNAVYSANNRNGSIWNFHIAWQLETTWVIQLWHASDTTLSRVSAWIMAIEWKTVATTDWTVNLTWTQTIAWVKTFSSFPITPSSAPTTDYQVASKKYVDDNAWGVSVKTITATRLDTAASWTVTYAHSLWKIPKCILVRANRSWYTSDWWGSEWSWLTWDVNKSAYVWYLSLTSGVWTSSTYAIYMWRLDTTIYIQAWVIQNVTSTNFDVVWTYTWTWIWANNVLHFTLLW